MKTAAGDDVVEKPVVGKGRFAAEHLHRHRHDAPYGLGQFVQWNAHRTLERHKVGRAGVLKPNDVERWAGNAGCVRQRVVVGRFIDKRFGDFSERTGTAPAGGQRQRQARQKVFFFPTTYISRLVPFQYSSSSFQSVEPASRVLA